MSLGTTLAIMGIGAGVGFLGGLFGKGGSAIATPLLALVGIPPIVAVASPLPATIPATSVAAYAYFREGRIRWDVFKIALVVGIPATALGAFLTRWISGSALVIVTEVVIAGLGIRFVVKPSDTEVSGPPPANFRLRLVLVAAVVGIISGLLANSGGFLLAPLYIVALHLSIKESFATSLAVGAVLAIPGTVVHAVLGHVDWHVVLVFGMASIPLSYVGARVALRTHAGHLERIYGFGLAVLGVTLLIVEH